MKMHQKTVRALILIACTLTYLIFGAAVFDLLESETDAQVRASLLISKQLMQHKYKFSADDYALLENITIRSIPHKAGLQWSFAGAFYFCTVVITTVGYGHSTPLTVAGKAVCMVYALFGIPLNLIMFQSIGERLNTIISIVLRKLCVLCENRAPVSTTWVLMVSLSIGTTVTALGTYVFHWCEDWSLFDSYYYCFVTLSTIGFGDFVPLQKDDQLQNSGYVVFTLLFILFGLAIFSACVNLLVLRCMAANTEQPLTARVVMHRKVILETLNDYLLPLQTKGARNGIGGSSIELQALNEGGPSATESPCAVCPKHGYFCINPTYDVIVLDMLASGTLMPTLTENSHHQARPVPFRIRRQPAAQISHLIDHPNVFIDWLSQNTKRRLSL